MCMKKVTLFIFIIFNLILCNGVFANNVEAVTPTVNANSESAVLMELDSGNTIFEKNSNEKLYPASTTKIMTAILTIENCDLDEIATVSEEAVYSVPARIHKCRAKTRRATFC